MLQDVCKPVTLTPVSTSIHYTWNANNFTNKEMARISLTLLVLIYVVLKNSAPTSQKTYCASVTQTSRLVLFKKAITTHYENSMTAINEWISWFKELPPLGGSNKAVWNLYRRKPSTIGLQSSLLVHHFNTAVGLGQHLTHPPVANKLYSPSTYTELH